MLFSLFGTLSLRKERDREGGEGRRFSFVGREPRDLGAVFCKNKYGIEPFLLKKTRRTPCVL
jgi:hypothetical protein